MNISTNIRYIAAAMLTALTLSSCDDISEDNRFIELPPIDAKRVVLLEEFTGQKCVNCPEAHEVVKGLLNTYPDNLISVSIHSGGDAFSFSEETLPLLGLRTADGQAYCDENKVAGLPAGVVNRTSGVLTSDKWAAAIREAIAEESNISLQLTALLNENNKIDITVEILSTENIDGHLQLWVVESGITALQLTPSGYKQDYEHNHVFRAAVNGHDGESIRLVTREPQTFGRTVEVRNDKNAVWNVDNLSIVAFVYTDKGVQQAAQAHVQK